MIAENAEKQAAKPERTSSLLRGFVAWVTAVILCLLLLSVLGLPIPNSLAYAMGGPFCFVVLADFYLGWGVSLIASFFMFVLFYRCSKPLVWCSLWLLIGIVFVLLVATRIIV